MLCSGCIWDLSDEKSDLLDDETFAHSNTTLDVQWPNFDVDLTHVNWQRCADNNDSGSPPNIHVTMWEHQFLDDPIAPGSQ
jgi:hypothetical protein